MAHRLSKVTLSQIGAGGEISTPAYDRGAVCPGIVHFGVGAFHRAHQVLVIDELLGRGLAQDWGIVGVGLMPADIHTRNALLPQDCLYTLVEKHSDGSVQARIIRSIIDYLYAPDDPGGVIELLADPGIRIVSLTITEGGCNIN